MTKHDQNVLLMFHHLELAALHFEETDSNLAIEDVVSEEYHRPAAEAWLKAMHAAYQEINE